VVTHARERDIDLLARGELPDPHSLLGIHPLGDGFVVRAWRPEAQAISCLGGGSVIAKLEMVHDAGLFEAPLESKPNDYRLEVSYPDGTSYEINDPYRFPPTLGEIDLHLIGEGRHRRLHRKLGAHVQMVDGTTGTGFAVWAPGARGVSVAGEFNSWDGRIWDLGAVPSRRCRGSAL
jgi:1,4-alpha-glucan branching enzyme